MTTATSATPICPPGYEVKLLAHSINKFGHVYVTFSVRLPRIMLAEMNVHNSASKNSASSRARPTKKVIEGVRECPFRPVHIGANQKGMQAEQELEETQAAEALAIWDEAREFALVQADRLEKLGLHKQLANRLLEVHDYTTIILSMTGDNLRNFLSLRTDLAAQWEIQVAAKLMQHEVEKSTPKLLGDDEWHLPLIFNEDRELAAAQYPGDPMALVKISAGRCARVSYLTHEGHRDLAADIGLHDRLLDGGHMSPTQHPARPFDDDEWEDTLAMQDLLRKRMEGRGANQALMDARLRQLEYVGNLQGFVQYRKLIPNEHNYMEALKSMGEKGW